MEREMPTTVVLIIGASDSVGAAVAKQVVDNGHKSSPCSSEPLDIETYLE